MSELISNLFFWAVTHTQTLAGMGMTFLLGGIFGMWIQFSNDDKHKNADHFAE